MFAPSYNPYAYAASPRSYYVSSEEQQYLRYQEALRQQEVAQARRRELARRQQLAELQRRQQLAEEYEEALQHERRRRAYLARQQQAQRLYEQMYAPASQKQQQPQRIPIHDARYIRSSAPSPQPARRIPVYDRATLEKAATIIQQRWRAYKVVQQRISSLNAVHAQLDALVASFTFPESPVFQSDGRLAYQHGNQSVHAHVDQLEKLLLKLDSIDSAGSDAVKQRRKQVVHAVNAALASVESWRATAWANQQAVDQHLDTLASSASSSTPATPISEAAAQSLSAAEPVEEIMAEADQPSSSPAPSSSPVAAEPAADAATEDEDGMIAEMLLPNYDFGEVVKDQEDEDFVMV